MNIAPNNSIEPDAAIISHTHFSDYSGVRCEEAAFPELGFFTGK
jgi:hypothetical protein